jgi:hypothetical protein
LKASQFSRNNCAEKLRHPTTRLGSVREKPGVSRSEIGQQPWMAKAVQGQDVRCL